MSAVVIVSVVLALIALGGAAWVLLRRARRPRGPFPVVLVHGLFGFDKIEVLGLRHDYFRGIVRALTERGDEVHVVRLPAAASVPERARALRDFIRELDAAQVNVIAHSMGGIDARYAISRLDLADRVASLVTIGTPHRGTPLAEVGNSAPARAMRAVLETVGVAASGSEWLTPANMTSFNESTGDASGVYYGSVVGRPRAEQTMLALKTSRMLLSRRAGSSDGVVPTESQAWGNVIIEAEADHWAQIGWSQSYDARPLYLRIVDHLRQRGL